MSCRVVVAPALPFLLSVPNDATWAQCVACLVHCTCSLQRAPGSPDCLAYAWRLTFALGSYHLIQLVTSGFCFSGSASIPTSGVFPAFSASGRQHSAQPTAATSASDIHMPATHINDLECAASGVGSAAHLSVVTRTQDQKIA